MLIARSGFESHAQAVSNNTRHHIPFELYQESILDIDAGGTPHGPYLKHMHKWVTADDTAGLLNFIKSLSWVLMPEANRTVHLWVTRTLSTLSHCTLSPHSALSTLSPCTLSPHFALLTLPHCTLSPLSALSTIPHCTIPPHSALSTLLRVSFDT